MDHLVLRIRIRRVRQERRRLLFYRANLRKLQLRDASDPFSTPEIQFRDQFRLPRVLARKLIDEVTPFLREPDRATAIPAHIKVLCTLQFFFHGSHQIATGKDFDLALSQSSVSRCIDEVKNVMNLHLFRRYLPFPRTFEERIDLQLKNYRTFDMPGVLGYKDGTHVALRAPSEREDLYVNRKSFHSLNVQITCDSDMIILNVLARFPGSVHHSYIWARCALRRKMEQLYRGGEKVWLLGDSGYPEEPWLHTPILDAPPNSKEAVYTQKHTSARNVVERCIGVLKGRFRCLITSKALLYHPEKVSRIVNSCVVLHNWCVEARVPPPEPLQPHDDNDTINDPLPDINRGAEDNVEAGDIGQGRRRGRRPLLVEGENVRQQHLIDPIPLPLNRGNVM